MINETDCKAQNAGYEEADGILNGTVVLYIDHDQLDNADHRQNQAVQSESNVIPIESDDNTYDGEQQ